MEQKLGPYRVVCELGRGGMGVVLKGHDDALKRPVAIKLLGEHVAHEKSFVARFLREAQSAAKLNHPNIVQIYFVGEDNGRHFFVMEFVEGRSVAQVLRDGGKLPAPRAAELVRQAAAGLAAAHDHGVIHRDIKPANLMLCSNGVLKIADFGLAVMPEDGARLTATGSVLGTPGYLSPEQCLAQKLDGRTDIYSLGVTFYEMLSGKLPFAGDSPFALVKQVVEFLPPPLHEIHREIPPAVSAVVQKMIAKRREDRHRDCHELIAELDAYLVPQGFPSYHGRATPPPLSRPGGAVAAAATPATAPAALDSGEDGPSTEVLTPAVAAAAAPAAARTGSGVPALRPTAAVVARTAPTTAAAPASAPAPARRGLGLAIAVLVAGLAGLAAGGALFVRKDPLGLFGRSSSARAAAEPGRPPAGPAAAGAAGLVEPPDAPVAAPARPPDEPGPAGTTASAAVESDPPSRGAFPAGAGGAAALGAAGAAAANPPSSAGAGGAPPVAPLEREPPPAVRGEGRASAPPPARQAVREPAAAAPPLPASPRLLVLATGEPLLADAIEKHVADALRSRGLDVADSAGFPDIDELRRRGERPGPAYRPLLEQAQVNVVLFADAEALAERELRYMNRSDTAVTARVRLNVFVAGERRAHGPGWSEKLEYTPLTVERKVEAAVDGLADALAESIRSGWSAYRANRGR